MTKRYTLFLDESETHKHDPMTHSDSDYHFCMAGVIVAEDDYAQLKNSVNQLKRNVWSELDNPECVVNRSRKGTFGCQKIPRVFEIQSPIRTKKILR